MFMCAQNTYLSITKCIYSPKNERYCNKMIPRDAKFTE